MTNAPKKAHLSRILKLNETMYGHVLLGIGGVVGVITTAAGLSTGWAIGIFVSHIILSFANGVRKIVQEKRRWHEANHGE